MKITVMTADEQIVTLDVDRDESVENFKALLEVETQVPLQRQQLLFNGKEMSNAEKLSALGVNDGDLIMMISQASSRKEYQVAWFDPCWHVHHIISWSLIQSTSLFRSF
ncbi:DNA damage-inducible protein [Actinidia chinensis var. chinensis]|uniref:DNA damage-inducible protein n=1 Tax=Actinidia chinensis var. chinensis TaxID=1590841 RepID=A0A2R6QD00_ACTCC|nr:DNA damage-inducible protein [Actinidia chinensis var. chinensis]